MNKKQAKQRIDELNKLTAYYAKKYYDEDKPEISDFEYDMLMVELRNLEAKYPEFIVKESLTQHVGGTVKEGFQKITHETPLLSMLDLFNYNDVEDYCKKLLKQAEENNIKNTDFVVETKIDGLTICLEYINGKFVRGATRGNGLIGEDVTNNLKTIKTIPMELKENITITVRGEIFISKHDFEIMNLEREKNEEELFANARNAAAGSLRQLNVEVVKKRPLDIYVYNVQKIEGKSFNSHYEELQYLEKIGFNINPVKILCRDINEVMNAIKKIGNMRDKLTYGIDGAVIKIDDLFFREILGNTEKTPRWQIAYKYPPEQKQTIIKDIICQVGRTGAITPLAILKPVLVDGSLISKTTLHNEDFIKEKDIRIGDTVLIKKAGDVIPEITEVIKSKRIENSKEFEMPKFCPVCGAPAKRENGESVTRCLGVECKAKILRSLEHFASRNAMNIEGLGESIIEQLVEKNLIKNIADIYNLDLTQIASLKKNGKKFAENLINSIENSKNCELYRLITALGIRHVGSKSAKSLAKKYKSIDVLMNANLEDLKMQEDIGDIMAESIYEFFKQEQTIDLINRLKGSGVNMKDVVKEGIDKRFENMIFVLTGRLNKYSREEASEIIEKFGGKTSSSISKKTTYLLVGEEAGSKLTKAKELGVKIITEDEFNNLIK